MRNFRKMVSYYKLTPIKLGCEVRGINLKIENRKEVIEKIKEDVTKHRLLIFKGQGDITGYRQVQISKWFGDLEVTFYQHEQSPHPQVFRVSNDPTKGCTGVGRTGWHIDGTFQPAPYAYSLYYMASVPKEGATVFAPLTEVIEGLSPEKYAEWDRLWMASDRRAGPVHPLIYTHPRSKKKRVLSTQIGWAHSSHVIVASPPARIYFRHVIDTVPFKKLNGFKGPKVNNNVVEKYYNGNVIFL
ncbi:hypothetical protein J6590_055753 [Homalodisca vitripennis]|nr:hypothetical protein J6590_055753 [Homalodisca vitripennis]